MKLKRSRFTTKLIVFALVLYAAAALISLRSLSEEAVAINTSLGGEVDKLKIENANIEYAIENHDDPDVIAEIARSYLGLALPDEVIVYDGTQTQEEFD